MDDRIVMSTLTLLGLVLFIMASVSFKHVGDECTNAAIKGGWTFIQVLGACLTTAGLSYSLCVGSRKCEYPEHSVRLFLSLSLAMLVLVGVAAMVMLGEYSKSERARSACDSEGSNRTRAGLALFIAAAGVTVGGWALFRPVEE